MSRFSHTTTNYITKPQFIKEHKDKSEEEDYND